MENSSAGKPYYKMTYFEGVRGRAEVVKIMFHLAGVEFTDKRVKLEDWMNGEKKKEYPLGKLPVLETERGTIAQSDAIAHYVAEKLGYLPEDDWDRAVTHSVTATANESATAVGLNRYLYTVYKVKEPPSEEEQEKDRELCTDTISKALSYIESLASKDCKFIHGNKMLLSDLQLYAFVEYCSVGFPKTREHSDWLKKILSNIERDPDMEAYLKAREPSPIGT